VPVGRSDLAASADRLFPIPRTDPIANPDSHGGGAVDQHERAIGTNKQRRGPLKKAEPHGRDLQRQAAFRALVLHFALCLNGTQTHISLFLSEEETSVLMIIDDHRDP
jgi:hypothetical protein